nr:diguanylate cyclase [Armatimonadota bacterium]
MLTLDSPPIQWQDLDLHQFVEAIPEALAVLELSSGKIILWNREASRLFGYSASETRGKTLQIVFPEQLRSQQIAALAYYREMVQGEQPPPEDRAHGNQGGHDANGNGNHNGRHAEHPSPVSDPQDSISITAQCKDGKEVFIALTLRVITPRSNKQPLLLAAFRNVTERTQCEEELNEKVNRFKTFLDHSPAVTYLKDEQGKYVYVNNNFERQFHLTQAQWEGKTDYDLWPAETAWKLRRTDDDVLEGGKTVELQETIPLDHSESHWLVYKFRVVDLSGQRFLAGIAVDITDRRRAETALNVANEELKARIAELEHRNREMALVGEMGELLQACHSPQEAYTVIARCVRQLFSDTSGTLSVVSSSSNLVETISAWGELESDNRLFMMDDCWGLRRGQMHIVHDTRSDVVCKHVAEPLPVDYLCMPLVAQHDTFGVLHLSQRDANRLTPSHQRLAKTVAEQVSLALANLKLQETLRNQSIRDPLTSLFNRRYMEASLERELRRGERNGASVGVIMLDLDHFKQFNDSFGHEAGDTLLRELGAFLQAHIRGEDVACRYGGEEFTIILPAASLEDTLQRAERLCEASRNLKVAYRGLLLGPVTLSAGTAAF